LRLAPKRASLLRHDRADPRNRLCHVASPDSPVFDADCRRLVASTSAGVFLRIRTRSTRGRQHRNSGEGTTGLPVLTSNTFAAFPRHSGTGAAANLQRTSCEEHGRADSLAIASRAGGAAVERHAGASEVSAFTTPLGIRSSSVPSSVPRWN